MQYSECKNQLLAVLFASGEPIEKSRLALAMDLEEEMVEKLLYAVEDELQDSALEVVRLGSQVQLCTRPQYEKGIRRALELKRNAPLSQAALEVLAIVAYNQPVTRAFVEQVRGVDSSGVMSSLVQKGLLEEAARLELPGRPLSYRTTANFLRCFGLEGLDRLPPLPQPEQQGEEDPSLLEGQMDFSESI